MRTRNLKTIFIYCVLTVMAIIFLFPLYWAVITAIKPYSEAVATPPTFFPHDIMLSNITNAWQAQNFTRYFFNSCFVTFFAVMGCVISTALISYGFARFDFKYKSICFALMLATMMIPWDVLVVPLYKEYSFLGWIDTYLPLIVPSFFGVAFYIFMMTQKLRTIPKDFDEAAIIMGASEWQIFTKIFLPIMRPSLILVGVLHMITVWNDYLGPLVYLNSPDKFTMAIGLSLFNGPYSSDTTAIMVITVIMVLPPLIVFMIMQKRILENDISTGFK